MVGRAGGREEREAGRLRPPPLRTPSGEPTEETCSGGGGEGGGGAQKGREKNSIKLITRSYFVCLLYVRLYRGMLILA